MFVGNTNLSSQNHLSAIQTKQNTLLNINAKKGAALTGVVKPMFSAKDKTKVGGSDSFVPAPSMYGRMKQLSAQFKRIFTEAEKGAVQAERLDYDPNEFYNSVFSYTKEDAVRRQWGANQPRPNLKEALEQGMGKITIPEGWNPSNIQSAEVLQEFESQLQKDGISDNLDFAQLRIDIRKGTISENGDGVFGDRYGAEVMRKTDYLASRFAAAEAKILGSADTPQREEQLSRLNEMFSNAISQSADNYAESISARLEQYGVSGEKDKIRSSVLRSYEAQVEAYRKGLPQNQALADLRDTKDEWLLKDDAYVAAVLRENSQSFDDMSDSSHAAYTIDDLASFAEITREMRSTLGSDAFRTSEESFGLRMASISMKLDTFGKSGSVSVSMSDTLQQLITHYTKSAIDTFANIVKQKKDAPAIAADVRGFADVDRDAIMRVYSQTMSYYYDSGDTNGAFEKGTDFAIKQFNQSQQSMAGVYRYQNSNPWALLD